MEKSDLTIEDCIKTAMMLLEHLSERGLSFEKIMTVVCSMAEVQKSWDATTYASLKERIDADVRSELEKLIRSDS